MTPDVEQHTNDRSLRSLVRDRILATASELFYNRGVHAVGIDTIISEADVAKSSLYRHFRTKDDLIAAYVESEDEAFWTGWDERVSTHDEPEEALAAVLTWIGTKIATPGYRGCPQLKVVAEFPDPRHPARLIATRHKNELRRRLAEIVDNAGRPDIAADLLWLLIDGAFTNHELLATHRDPVTMLVEAGAALISVGPDTR